MGGDREPWEVAHLATLVKENFPTLKTAWYSGNNDSNYKYSFDYVKLGPYIKELGPITEKTTNQRMYMMLPDGEDRKQVLDITYKFWK
jgi:anaerobic ribonucleoside-triphosphate reductase activating protein